MRAVVWFTLALALGGCGNTRTCKQGTVLLSITLEGAAAGADRFEITADFDGIAQRSASVAHTGGPSGTLELRFPAEMPYRAGQRLSLALAATRDGESLGYGALDPVALPSGCAALALTVHETAVSDLAGDDLAPIELDLAPPPDLAAPLAAPKLTGLTASAGTLSPAFSPDEVQYTLDVRLLTQSLTVTATADAPATLTVNGASVGSGVASAPLPLNLGATTITVVATGPGGSRIYLLTVTRGAGVDYLKASNTGVGDELSPVAISGDTLVVSAPKEDSSTTGINTTPNESALQSGAVYVFVRSGSTWTQQAYIKPSNTGADDYFGWSVALSGDTLAVSAVYEDSSTTGINTTPNEGAENSGAVYVFVRSGSTWTQLAYLKPSHVNAHDGFGRSLALSGDTLVVGETQEDSSTTGINTTPNESAVESGAVYVFVRSGSTWTQQAYLKPSNTGAGDWFGWSVALSGDTLAVGSKYEDSSTIGVNTTPNENAMESGAAYVFVRSGSTWTQQAYLKASNTGANDQFGYNVALSGDTLAVGAIWEDSSTTGVNATPNESATDSGAVYVFVRSGSTWMQQAYVKASNTGQGDWFSSSVAVSGDTLAVGAIYEDSSTNGINSTPNESASNSGAVYVFGRSGSAWTQQAYVKASNTGLGDSFGASVALSADTLAVGAYLEDSSTTGINTMPNESAMQSGAVYVY